LLLPLPEEDRSEGKAQRSACECDDRSKSACLSHVNGENVKLTISPRLALAFGFVRSDEGKEVVGVSRGVDAPEEEPSSEESAGSCDSVLMSVGEDWSCSICSLSSCSRCRAAESCARSASSSL
jgi:hypothetical protein